MFVFGIWSIISLFFFNLIQCDPVAAQWDYTILEKDPKAWCVSATVVVDGAYALSVLSILSDWFYAILPIPMIWDVKMTVEAKLIVSLVLNLGVFDSIATLIRLKFLADLTDTQLTYFVSLSRFSEKNLRVAGTDVMVWTLVEPGIAITAASLVTVCPLLRKSRIGGFTSSERSTITGDGGYHDRASKRISNMPGFGSKELTLVDDVEARRTMTIGLDNLEPATSDDGPNNAPSKTSEGPAVVTLKPIHTRETRIQRGSHDSLVAHGAADEK
ncbi:integral membrane family protein [Xylariaceae sp. FL0255]|nr:integral membrane family protein [Xylariaceae sp. FL0255]